jgi:molybdopterin molybdotransferase
MPVERYRSLVLAGIRPAEPVRTLLAGAHGCALAAEITAPRDLPPFPSSAMDGFALRSADVAGASHRTPARLRLAGEVRMGFAPPGPVPPGGAVAVPTGGMLPGGADTVVPVEVARIEGGSVVVDAPSAAGRNVRPAGEDLRRGEVLVPAGRRLEAADLGALAAGGYAAVRVHPRPRVAILSTGNELVPPGGEPAPGQIHESNSYLLQALVQDAGGRPFYAGHVPDDPDALVDALTAAAASADMVVCSGGVSAGPDDPVKRAFAGSDAIRFFQVAVQPGRPQAFGSWSGKPFFGLPGNPMAALAGFVLFVRPALELSSGLPPGPVHREAVSEGPLEASPDSVRLVPVRLIPRGPVLAAAAGGKRRSNQLARLAAADALVEVPPGRDIVADDPCRVILLRPGNA